MIKEVSFLLLVILVFAYGCKTDNKATANYELDGKWSIYEAYRDGDMTNTLEDGFFEFQDSQLITNILGSPISGAYQMMDGSFKHESSLPATYEIKEYSGDTMNIETEIRGFDFLFKLERMTDSIPSPK